ncbi:hypothetical protein DFH08DRAFT_807202 [Mycena albidolilacea]|uniref:Uncharacterized protein n=1 Tax=Mycena albidolilacea TaxID=1033008 RepID=A0AAD7A6C6_9AGAR|nr:hypothetical protein DFH08DRAFT_807202 [Mycena albidolilacea]
MTVLLCVQRVDELVDIIFSSTTNGYIFCWRNRKGIDQPTDIMGIALNASTSHLIICSSGGMAATRRPVPMKQLLTAGSPDRQSKQKSLKRCRNLAKDGHGSRVHPRVCTHGCVRVWVRVAILDPCSTRVPDPCTRRFLDIHYLAVVLHPSSKLEYFCINKVSKTANSTVETKVRVGPKVLAGVPVSILKLLGPKRAATRLIAEHVTIILPPVTALYAAWYL